MTTAEKLIAIAENVPKVYEAGRAAGGLPDGDMSDPDYVYAVTRPKDWLPMPTPGDDEMYFLCQTSQYSPGVFVATLTFSGSCSVEFGTVENGIFVPKESLTPTSGQFFQKVIEPSEWGDLTAEENVQCMVKVKGKITKFVGAAPSDTLYAICVVDAVCGIHLSALQLGNANYSSRSWGILAYFRFVGNGGAENLSNGFMQCKQLSIVSCEKNNVVSNLTSTFSRCHLLRAVSPNLLSGSNGAVVASNLLTEAHIAILPKFSFVASNFSGMFAGSMIREVDMSSIDTSACTTAGNLFYNAYSLKRVKDLNISSLTTIANNTFINTNNLQRITFAGETTPGGLTLNLSYSKMGHDALVELINSLPTARAAATVTLTNNPGALELTDAEIAVATAKNWTITI